MPTVDRILPPHLRERFGGRMPVEHTLGRCSGGYTPFPGLPAIRCTTQVRAATGYVAQGDPPQYFCQDCGAKMPCGG
jgi:hypothetical protein